MCDASSGSSIGDKFELLDMGRIERDFYIVTSGFRNSISEYIYFPQYNNLFNQIARQYKDTIFLLHDESMTFLHGQITHI